MDLTLAKVKGENLCRKFKSGEGDHVGTLDHLKQEQADAAKSAALEILQDALDKKLYGNPPDYMNSCTLDPDPFKYSSVLTKELLENMIEEMKKVTFLENTDDEYRDVYAYVNSNERSKVYLCPLFWGAADHLSEDSKPGTLIHEVSHFLGTEDISYDFVWIELHETMGTLVGTAVAYKEDVKIILGESNWNTSDSQNNANCIEYEFEMILNHTEDYSVEDQKYPCCGEKKRNSVCLARDIGHYVNETVLSNVHH